MFIPSSLKEPAKMSLQELKTHIQRKDQILPIEEDKEDYEALVLKDLHDRNHQQDITIDEYIIRMKQKEAEVTYWKTEIQEATAAKKAAEFAIDTIKKGFKSIKRNILAPDENLLSGKFYQAQFVKMPTTDPRGITFIPLKKLEEFSIEEQNLWWIQKDTIIEKKVVVRSIKGEPLSEDISPPSIKQETILNQDALRNAYNSNQELPQGIRAIQSITLRTKRISPKLDMETS